MPDALTNINQAITAYKAAKGNLTEQKTEDSIILLNLLTNHEI